MTVTVPTLWLVLPLLAAVYGLTLWALLTVWNRWGWPKVEARLKVRICAKHGMTPAQYDEAAAVLRELSDRGTLR